MNEKRAFWMLVGFGVFAILVNSVGLFNNSAMPATDNQLAAVGVSGSIDLTVSGITRASNGSLSVQVKNLGTGSISAPSDGVLSDGVCVSTWVVSTSTSPVPYDNMLCLAKEQYPVSGGKTVNINLPVGYSSYQGKIMIGVDGVYPDFMSNPPVFKTASDRNKIVETNSSNNSLTVDLPSANLARGKVVTTSSGGNTSACSITSTNAADSCCLNKDAYKSQGTCSGFAGQDPFASKAVDGNAASLYCSARRSSVAGYSDFVTVDLGASKPVGRVVFSFPDKSPYACAAPTDFQIQVSNNNSTWTTVVTKTGQTQANQAIDFAQVSARYVRLSVTKVIDNSGWRLGVKEFEVYQSAAAQLAALSAPSTLSTSDTSSDKGLSLAKLGQSNGMIFTQDKDVSGRINGYVQDPTRKDATQILCGWYVTDLLYCANEAVPSLLNWIWSPNAPDACRYYPDGKPRPEPAPQLHAKVAIVHDVKIDPPLPLRIVGVPPKGYQIITGSYDACTRAGVKTILNMLTGWTYLILDTLKALFTSTGEVVQVRHAVLTGAPGGDSFSTTTVEEYPDPTKQTYRVP